MKYLAAAILTLGTAGLVTVAQASRPEPKPIPRFNAFEYSCKFAKSWDYGKGGSETTYCRVKGFHCSFDIGKPPVVEGNEGRCKEENKVWIECSDGYELRERDAVAGFSGDDFLVSASGRGKIATLKIEDLDRFETDDRRDRDDEFDATLVVANGIAQTYHGECEIDHRGPRPEPTKTTTSTPEL